MFTGVSGSGKSSLVSRQLSKIHHYSADQADYEEFLKRRAAVMDAIRADHLGLSKATLTKLEDGTYADTWRWDSLAEMGAEIIDEQ